MSVLMVDPQFYDVVYAINPHMQSNIGKVDRKKACQQWKNLHDAYERLGFPVHVMPGQKQFPDMVFAANQSFPFLDASGRKKVFLSHMASKQRAGEVAFFAEWYHENGYEVLSPPGHVPFEGMGDLLSHPGKRPLWGGYGFRTDPKIYDVIEKTIGSSILHLELVDPDFYHLDTCLAPINEACALYYPKAFTPAGEKLLKHHFDDLIVVNENEARHGFACNGHSPDGKHFLLHRGSSMVCKELQKRGVKPIELDTSEFLKSGGSVFCMKMMVW